MKDFMFAKLPLINFQLIAALPNVSQFKYVNQEPQVKSTGSYLEPSYTTPIKH